MVRADGNVSQAARDLGMQRTLLHALLRRYGIASKAPEEEQAQRSAAPSSETLRAERRLAPGSSF